MQKKRRTSAESLVEIFVSLEMFHQSESLIKTIISMKINLNQSLLCIHFSAAHMSWFAHLVSWWERELTLAQILMYCTANIMAEK